MTTVQAALAANQDEEERELGELAPAPVPADGTPAETESPAKRAAKALDAHFERVANSSSGGHTTDWNRASGLGDLCDRKLTYQRVIAPRQGWVTPWLQQIFSDGNDQERYWQRVLLEAGFKLDQTQQRLEWPAKRIRGHIDGVVTLPDDTSCVYEHKRLDANAWRGINRWQDFLRNDIYRHYPAQLGIYLLLYGKPNGLFCITAQGHYKWLDFSLDDPEALDYVEQAIQQAERVNTAIECGTLPNRLLDPSPCARCRYADVCLPDVVATEVDGVELIENETLERLLSQREINEAGHRAYVKADKTAKAILSGKPRAQCADWTISGKEVISRRVNTKAMPDDLRERYEVEGKSWRTTIKRTPK